MPRPAFQGGIHPHAKVPPLPIVPLPPPGIAVFPLVLEDGTALRPLVRDGDFVPEGAPLAASPHPSPIILRASVSGRVSGPGFRPGPRGGSVPTLMVEAVPAGEWMRKPRREDRETVLGRNGQALRALGLPLPETARRVAVAAFQSDPALSAETRLAADGPAELVEALEALLSAWGAVSGGIAADRSDRGLVRSLRQAARRSGRVAVWPLRVRYPMDHPSVLTPGLFGVPPPPDVAVLGAGTLLAAGRALATGRPCLDTHVTVSGPGVASPRNLRVRLGTPVRDCIAACGGYTAESVRLIAGGVLRGASLVSDHAAVFHETAGITVLTGPEPSGASEMPCILCGRCLHCCPAGLFPHELDEAVSGAPSRAERLGLSACLLCGCCAFICPSRRRITERLARAKLARPPGGDG